MIRQEGSFFNTPPIYTGTVESGFPNVKIKIFDMVLDKDNLMVDKWLKDRSLTLTTENADCLLGGGPHKHEVKQPIYDLLTKGDTVVLVKHEEKFIILSKVVSI